jgi:hypothetical protein
MRSSLLTVGALSVTGLVGCGLPQGTDAPDAEATSQTATAIVVVERSSGPGEAIRGDAVVARFVKVRQGAVDDSMLRLAGVAQDLPQVGSCTATFERPASSAAGRQVDLLDVGAVTFEGASGRSTTLLPRAMPDPAGVVSGNFYSARSGDAFASGGRVQLRATGGADLIDGFTVAVPSPHDLGDVTLTPITGGIDVAWDASEADGRDVVYVDVSAASRLVMRCSTLDTGRVVVPTAIDDGDVAVHRVHREAFHAKGIDPGEVRFDLARVTTFHRF